MPQPTDFTTRDFARLLNTLPAHLPISDEYDAHLGQKVGRWWTSQREHMVGWFNGRTTHGAGAYSRETPNDSARTTYNRLLNPGSLLWIAEALGVDSRPIQRAADAAAAESDHRRRCGQIRAVLPWSVIASAASAAIGPVGQRPVSATSGVETDRSPRSDRGMNRIFAARGRGVRARGGTPRREPKLEVAAEVCRRRRSPLVLPVAVQVATSKAPGRIASGRGLSGNRDRAVRRTDP